jgi:hypothetical protein
MAMLRMLKGFFLSSSVYYQFTMPPVGVRGTGKAQVESAAAMFFFMRSAIFGSPKK